MLKDKAEKSKHCQKTPEEVVDKKDIVISWNKFLPHG